MAQRVSRPPGRRAAWALVDLEAISHNLRTILDHVGAGRRVIAVVKANAYGHGAVPVARRLESEGVGMLGVAFPEEGLELRQAGIRAPILVLGASSPDQIPSMLAASLTPTIYSMAFLEALLASAAPAPSTPILFHLKVDTGMGRLGILPEQVQEALSRISARPGRVSLQGLFTTLSCSDDPADPHTRAQLETFGGILERTRAAGLPPAHVHAANSGGVIDHPLSWLDTVRPGIMLYGIHPSASSSRLDLRPALSWHASIVMLKTVPAGAPLGYGRSFVATRVSRIATVPVGYADGLSRSVASVGHALVRGSRAPYAGRISMDHAMLDVTDVDDAQEGDEVALLGRQGDKTISAEMMAGWAGTIAYEVLSRIGHRVLRLHTSATDQEESL